jgi:glycosyltransferase involved in cell wall biosynthesis
LKDVGGTIHVVHLIGSTGLYGAERWILALMCAMDKQRVRSTLVNLVDVEEEKSAVVQAAEQRGLDAFDFVTGGKFNPFAATRLANWAREQQLDIIHGHGFKSDLLGLLTATLAGCRVMTTPHGWSLGKDRKLQFYEKLDRFSFRYMNMVCPLSPDLADGLTGSVDHSRLRLIFNGVDIDEIQEAESVQRSYPESYTIGYIGQLIERKDMPTLISALHILAKERDNIRLIVLGDGAKRVELREESERLGISGRVDFLGFRPDAAAWLKTFDLFILPSRLEGIPRCIMEAMAATVPVVVTDIPGNRNLVSHKDTGLLYSVGDSRQLAECIAFMMDHPAEAQEMAIRGKRKVEEEYSSRKMAREYAEIYQELVEHRK